ncbi:uncharacterized protein [Rutidosis leptorrhynchoides]|uniref:uncharacterized protein n=1 Tax=Rutidosis leptorrhynchoides TaxID=125765 RepID=UPI003A9A4568
MRRSNETLRLILTTYIGVVIGFFLGVSFPTLLLFNQSNLSPSISLRDVEDKYPGLPTQSVLNIWSSMQHNELVASGLPKRTKIWAPQNPRGAERLPPDLIAPESDLYTRSLWGSPSEDLTMKPNYLVAFTVGYEQKDNIDKAVKKFSDNFTLLLFHYDGRTSEWNEFEWSKKAIHVSAPKQSKWWYAKRFLHPDIVAPYDYIFIWDEDLGLDDFDAEKYIQVIKKHGLEISQPGLLGNSRQLSWQMTKKQNNTDMHKSAKERVGWCFDPHLPPCAAFVEIMAPVFSRNAWRCVWHMIQNDLVHGWGLDFALRRCVQPAHEKIGVVDAQPIVHQTLPSLGNQGIARKGKPPRVAVRERCRREWITFQIRMALAEKAYLKMKEKVNKARSVEANVKENSTIVSSVNGEDIDEFENVIQFGNFEANVKGKSSITSSPIPLLDLMFRVQM